MLFLIFGNAYKKERAKDELPQSAAGKTVMTTEPKFVPNEAVEITIGSNLKLKTRMVDCVRIHGRQCTSDTWKTMCQE